MALRYVQFTQDCMDYIEKSIVGTWRGKWLRQAEKNRKLDREVIRNSIPKEMDDRHLMKVTEENAQIEVMREKMLISEERLCGCLKSTQDFLTSIANTWEHAVPMRKRLIQKIVFPVGVRLESATKFGTLELPPMIAISKIPLSESSKLAGECGNRISTAIWAIARNVSFQRVY